MWKYNKDIQKTNKKRLNVVNKQIKKIAEKLNIDNRIEKLQKTQAYITVKDGKKGFTNNPSFRLIIPSQSDIGRLSKKTLDKTNQRVIRETKFNQWINTNTVIAWFKSLREKSSLSLVNFDIESFYLSISLNLVQSAIDFAQEKVDITVTDISITMQARKMLLF